MRPGAPLNPLLLATLHVASLLVPRPERASWLAGWISELWYVRQAVVTSPYASLGHSLLPQLLEEARAQMTLIAFCLGSFEDAFSLRLDAHLTRRASRWQLGLRRPTVSSASGCLLLLTCLALGACVVALLLPQARVALTPAPSPARDLLLVAPEGQVLDDQPQVRLSEFRHWRTRSQHLFRDFAFFEPTRKPVHLAPHLAPELSLARATPNLFNLLGSPVLLGPVSVPATQRRLVLSEHLWRTSFHADPGVFGRSVHVGIHPAILAGYLPDTAWQMPGRFDAWLLEPDAAADALPSLTRGFVLARLVWSAEHASFGDRWSFTIQQPDGGFAPFECLSPKLLTPHPFNTFLFITFLALLALPATTSLSLGEYPAYTDRLSNRNRIRRWLFLTAKICLLVPGIYLASLDLTYLLPNLSANQHQYLQIVSTFSLALFALRWVLRDQRHRCPVCLSVLTNPARVGQPSRNFLAWNGLELICSGGHGLLHVPELPTSWFQTQRWLYLDPSWRALFLTPP